MRTRPRKAIQPKASTDWPVVVFDGDDTLWKTQCLYDRAKARLATLLAGTAPERLALIEEFDRFDAHRAEQIGLTPHRFLESIAMFYAERRALTPAKASDSKKVCALASEILQVPKLFRDTVSTLETLRASCHLFLLTAGDERAQRRKVRQTGLRVFFKKVWIVRQKNERILRDLLAAERLCPEKCWMVGNSLRSDVMPALANGLRVLHLERGGWRYDAIHARLENPLYRKIPNLGAVARIILRQRASSAPILHTEPALHENAKRQIMAGLTQE
jgi:putative hydrolase of the HAD superfamily